MTARNARDVALDALVRIEDGAFANVALPHALRATSLDRRDRAQVTELVYGTVRRQRALDFVLAPFLKQPVERLDPVVRCALRMGAQDLAGGTPPHAAVSETVDAVGRRQRRATGLVNAVLRRVAESGPRWALPEGDDVTSVGIRTSMPDWIVQRLRTDLGPSDAGAVLEHASSVPGLTLRPNGARTTADEIERELVAGGATVSRGRLVPDALVVQGAGDPASLAPIADGRATPQDQASQAVAALVGAQPGERVLEIGAAPGGKATAMAEAMRDAGCVVAVDVHEGRTELVARAARRLGLSSVAPVVADGRRLPARPGSFDRVLLDAPCTGLGVLRRRPEARWRLRPEAVEELAALARDLLRAAAGAVRPGGTLLYSVCTLTEAETVGVDRWAQDALADFVAVETPGAPWRPWGRGALLLPTAADTDGMFVLGLRRTPDR
jgi:16S rRNA (cytosine967-C5)-methyltransferase